MEVLTAVLRIRDETGLSLDLATLIAVTALAMTLFAVEGTLMRRRLA